MTLILGLNLTDSAYLAADTRVTQIRGGKVVGTHDNLMKIWGNQDGIWCAVAGDAGLAKYLLNELRYESFARRGIESVRENIEAFIYEKADAYWRLRKETSHVTLMFAGSSKHRKARIEGSLIDRLVDAHINNKEASSEYGTRKFMIYNDISKSGVDYFRTNIYATDLFAVQVSDQGIKITDTVAGEHLAYGSPGLVKEDIALKEIARIEFGDSNIRPMMMTSYINWMKDKRNLQGVGSTVIPIHIQPDGTSIVVTGTTYSVDVNDNDVPVANEVSSIDVDSKSGKFYRLDKGNRFELSAIATYEPLNEGNQSLFEM